MAKDPKASRASLRYEGGRVTACLGLIEYLFNAASMAPAAETKKDKRGRIRLKNLRRRVAAVGGKQLTIYTKDGEKYQVHYSGPLHKFVANCVPRMNRNRVKGYSTVRGSEQDIL